MLKKVIVLVGLSVFIGTAQASITSIGSSLQGEGRLYTGVNSVVTTKTDSQIATTDTLNVADTHAVSNASASTVASASWINNAQGNVNFSDINLFLGEVPVETSGQNSGMFTYDFSTDTDATITIDYTVAMQASGQYADFFLNTEEVFAIDVFGTNGVALRGYLGSNATGQLSGALIAGNDYKLTLSRFFIGASNSAGATEPTINMQQSANFDWQIVSAVPVPAAAWLFGSALIGLVGIKRKKIKA